MLDPYAEVDWTAWDRLHSFTHEHTHRANPGGEEWDESPAAQERFEGLYARGIRHFPISNYHPAKPTYPLTDYFSDIPADALGCPNGEHSSGDPGHYCGVGCTFTSINRTFDGSWQDLFDGLLDGLVYQQGGGIVINHPRRSGLDTGTIAARLEYDPRVLGIEVWNHRGVVLPKYQSRGNALGTWDELLMDGRAVWGFFSPDYHSHWDGRSRREPARGRNILLVPERTEEAAAQAYRSGHFFGALDGTGLVFERITATPDEIVVETNRARSITFVSFGQPVRTVYNRTARFVPAGDEVYVRIEAADATGERIFSQPILFGED